MGQVRIERERGIKGVRHSREVHAKLVDELTLKMDRLIGKAVTNFFSVTWMVALGLPKVLELIQGHGGGQHDIGGRYLWGGVAWNRCY